jgi:hypothetical protein
VIVVGVDPGGATTGIVVRDGATPVRAMLVSNSDGDMSAGYLAEVIDALDDAITMRMLCAVEGLVEPNPHVRLANVRGLLDTAQVLGAVRHQAAVWTAQGRLSGVVVVPPGGHGSAPLACYPAVLVGEREKRGTGRLRHGRSAWDIAGAGVMLARMPVP